MLTRSHGRSAALVLVAALSVALPNGVRAATQTCAQLNDRLFGSDGRGGAAARFRALKAKIDAETQAGQAAAAAKDRADYSKLAASIVAGARSMHAAHCTPRIASGGATLTDGAVVALQPANAERPISGLWRLHLHEQTANFEKLGASSDERWLDGRTADGTVGLAPTTTGIYTGTFWLLVPAQTNLFKLKCLGNIEGARWLNFDGKTVRLVTDQNAGGNVWHIVRQ